MKILLSAGLTLLAVLFTHVPAQSQSQADILEAKLSHYVEIRMPGWKHKRVEPMLGTSKDVLTEFWGWSNRVVKISVVPHKSAEEARNALLEFVKYDLQKRNLNGLGDEAYSWGYGLGSVAFRTGRFNVYVSTVADVDEDADAHSLSQRERSEREKSEMKRLSQEFAKHVATAIDLP